MVGMKRKNMIFMILIHGISYSLPGTALAFITAQIIIIYFQPIIEETLKHSITPVLTFKAVVFGVGLGLIVPVIASYFPIRKALSSNIRDSLDRRHNKLSGFVITIENKLYKVINANKTLIAIGGSFSIIGGLLCYFLPASLISMNIANILSILFAVLLCMLFGMIMLSMNLQPMIEQIVLFVVFFVFFWEKKGINIITRKNLLSHKLKNKKTAIMFAMSITCIIFLQSVSDVELNTMEYNARVLIGADVRVDMRSTFNSGNFWPLLKSAEEYLSEIPEVRDWAFMSEKFEQKINAVSQVRISNTGRVDPYRTEIRAISPNFFDVVEPTFGKMKFHDSISELNNQLTSIQSEQLYSFEGENRMIFPSAYRDEFVMNGNINDKLVLKIFNNDVFYWKEIQPLSYLDNAPLSNMAKVMSHGLTSLVSFPTLYELGKNYFHSIKEVPIQYMIISYYPNITTTTKKNIKSKLLNVFNMKVSVNTLDSELEFTKDVRVILNYAFSAITVAFSLIAFFSLSNIMYMNIMEQKQEIGILRSLGLNRFSLIKIYIYEGFTILMSAGILGIIVGYILGVTIMKQRTEFIQIPLSFSFPYKLILVVFGCCIVSAILATIGPLLSLSKQSKIIKLLKE